MFWSETGSGFQDLGSTPPTRIPRFTLPQASHPPPPDTHTHTHKMYINSKSVSYCFHINTAIKIISTHGSCFTCNCRFYLSLHLAEVLSVNHAHCTSHAHARKNIFQIGLSSNFFFFSHWSSQSQLVRPCTRLTLINCVNVSK